MIYREFLYRVVWCCVICGGEQTRGYDKKPRPSNHFEGGETVHRAMICKGPCRRPPATKIERAAVAGEELPAGVFLGALDGCVPDTTVHLMLSVNHNRAEKRRRAGMR